MENILEFNDFISEGYKEMDTKNNWWAKGGWIFILGKDPYSNEPAIYIQQIKKVIMGNKEDNPEKIKNVNKTKSPIENVLNGESENKWWFFAELEKTNYQYILNKLTSKDGKMYIGRMDGSVNMLNRCLGITIKYDGDIRDYAHMHVYMGLNHNKTPYWRDTINVTSSTEYKLYKDYLEILRNDFPDISFPLR